MVFQQPLRTGSSMRYFSAALPRAASTLLSKSPYRLVTQSIVLDALSTGQRSFATSTTALSLRSRGLRSVLVGSGAVALFSSIILAEEKRNKESPLNEIQNEALDNKDSDSPESTSGSLPEKDESLLAYVTTLPWIARATYTSIRSWAIGMTEFAEAVRPLTETIPASTRTAVGGMNPLRMQRASTLTMFVSRIMNACYAVVGVYIGADLLHTAYLMSQIPELEGGLLHPKTVSNSKSWSITLAHHAFFHIVASIGLPALTIASAGGSVRWFLGNVHPVGRALASVLAALAVAPLTIAPIERSSTLLFDGISRVLGYRDQLGVLLVLEDGQPRKMIAKPEIIIKRGRERDDGENSETLDTGEADGGRSSDNNNSVDASALLLLRPGKKKNVER